MIGVSMRFIFWHGLNTGLLLMLASLLVSENNALSDLLSILACVAFVAGFLGSFIKGRRRLKEDKKIKARVTAKADVTRR